MGYKAVIFDLDDTLYEYVTPNKVAMNKVFELVQTKENIPYEEVKTAFYKARQKNQKLLLGRAASHNRLLYFQKTLEELNCPSVKLAFEMYNVFWDTFLENIALFDGVQELFDELIKKDIKICILTDLTAHIQFRKLIKLDIADKISFLVTSEEVGAEKPHPIIFHTALEKLNLTKNEVIMVGDSYKKDIEGALNLAIDCVWCNYDNKEMDKVDEKVKVIKNFKDLREVVL